MQVERMCPYEHLTSLCIFCLGLVCLVLVWVNQLPIRTCLHSHFTQQCIGGLEVNSPSDLPEEMHFGKQICFGFEMIQGAQGSQSSRHLNNNQDEHTLRREKELKGIIIRGGVQLTSAAEAKQDHQKS